MRVKTTEAPVLRACLDYLALVRITAWRNNSTGVCRSDRSGRQFWTSAGNKGLSDIIGILPGGFMLAVEVKRPGGKKGVRPEQVAFLNAVRDHGGCALIVDDVRQLQAGIREYLARRNPSAALLG